MSGFLPLFSSFVEVRVRERPESEGMIELRDILVVNEPAMLLERDGPRVGVFRGLSSSRRPLRMILSASCSSSASERVKVAGEFAGDGL